MIYNTLEFGMGLLLSPPAFYVFAFRRLCFVQANSHPMNAIAQSLNKPDEQRLVSAFVNHRDERSSVAATLPVCIFLYGSKLVDDSGIEVREIQSSQRGKTVYRIQTYRPSVISPGSSGAFARTPLRLI